MKQPRRWKPLSDLHMQSVIRKTRYVCVPLGSGMTARMPASLAPLITPEVKAQMIHWRDQFIKRNHLDVSQDQNHG
jgi:hypothetical protein